MSDDPKPKRRVRRALLWSAGVFTALVWALGALGVFLNALNNSEAEALGPVAASLMLDAFGDPCGGVDHPKWNTDARREIVDGVQADLGAETTERWLVQKVAKKDRWAYIETAPPDTGDYWAYILKKRGSRWIVRWDGPTGARPGVPTGPDPYPRDFGTSAQDILSCQMEGCQT
jgi:hypothetical protein